MNVEVLLLTTLISLALVGHATRLSHGKLARQLLLVHLRESGPDVDHGSGGVTNL